MNVRECMSTDVRIATPQDTIQTAARTMKALDVGVLPVGENDRLVGMITDRDIALRAVAEGLDPDTPVRRIMTPEIEYVFDDDDLAGASTKMSALKVRRLPVLNRRRRLVGILSLGDVAQANDPVHMARALHGVTEPGGPHTQY